METFQGINAAILKLQKQAAIYAHLLESSKGETSPILDLSHTPFFEEVIENFGPCLPLFKSNSRS